MYSITQLATNYRSLITDFALTSQLSWHSFGPKWRPVVTVYADNPITHPEDDDLGWAAPAGQFARQILKLDATAGAVVGVLGAWGSGKTSFINLARPEFQKAGAPVLDFNPWMFSGTQQLVELFFSELSAQLRMRPDLVNLGESLADYGEALSGLGWLPLVGTWMERVRFALEIIRAASKHRKHGVGETRVKVEKALQGLTRPILIILDDIDRLTGSEIRDIFRLVRLTASFPNLIYITAFDRYRVEEALAEQGISGRDYLEKILQFAIDLPPIPQFVLSQQVASSLNNALTDIEKTGPFQQDVWPDIFSEIVLPLIRNMRDVRRYAAAINATVNALDGQVALADALGLEAIRVFLPDVFIKLHHSVDALTSTEHMGLAPRRNSPELTKRVEDLIQTGRQHTDIVRAMIGRLFPAALRHIGNTTYTDNSKATWLKERRVAHKDILGFYLERVAGEGLQSFTDAERAWTLFGDRDLLDRYLRSLDRTRLQDVIASFEIYQDEFTTEHAVPAATVLLNLQPDIPERQRNMFELDSRFTVTRVVLRLLRAVKEPDATDRAVRTILPELKSLSSKLELIRLVGHRENVGHKLISENAAAALERLWRDEVRTAPVKQLLKERDIGAILFSAKREADPSETALTVPELPELTIAVLRSARTEVRSQSLNSRAVRRSARLQWDALIDLYGNEAILRQRIEQLETTQLEDDRDLIELAQRYLSGWRPSRFDED